jgi:pimeloyl-ACP methyl ester carboxylesterase
VREIDLGPCKARIFEGSGEGWAVVLPGARYSPDAPLLWFARETALASGRSVLAVYDTWRRDGDPLAWVEERTGAALEHIGPAELVVVGKSITSLAARIAAQRGLAGVWLTPLIRTDGSPVTDAVVDGLRAATGPTLLVGGSADPTWDGELARSLGEVLEIRDADHLLQISGDPHRSLEALRVVTQRLKEFLTAR